MGSGCCLTVAVNIVYFLCEELEAALTHVHRSSPSQSESEATKELPGYRFLTWTNVTTGCVNSVINTLLRHPNLKPLLFL